MKVLLCRMLQHCLSALRTLSTSQRCLQLLQKLQRQSRSGCLRRRCHLSHSRVARQGEEQASKIAVLLVPHSSTKISSSIALAGWRTLRSASTSKNVRGSPRIRQGPVVGAPCHQSCAHNGSRAISRLFSLLLKLLISSLPQAQGPVLGQATLPPARRLFRQTISRQAESPEQLQARSRAIQLEARRGELGSSRPRRRRSGGCPGRGKEGGKWRGPGTLSLRLWTRWLRSSIGLAL